MAFARGKESKDFQFKLYTGIAALKVTAVNPTAEELAKMRETEVGQPINYVGTTTIRVGDDTKEVPQVRLSFICATDKEVACNNGIEATVTLPFFLNKSYRHSKSGKVQVIDKFGRTAWVTEEEFKAKKVPTYTDKQGNTVPFQVDKDYRALFMGEEELTSFIKTLLNIDSPTEWDNENRTFKMKKDTTACECRFEVATLEKLFKGDFSDIKEIISYQPDNKLKVLLGVRTTNEGKQFQTFYNKTFMHLGVSNFEKLAAEVATEESEGRLKNTFFEVGNLKEYVATPTSYAATPISNDDPFSQTPDSTSTEEPSAEDLDKDLPF
jgi:hypothetical protein